MCDPAEFPGGFNGFQLRSMVGELSRCSITRVLWGMAENDDRRSKKSKLQQIGQTMVHHGTPHFFQPEPNANSSSGGSANLVRKDRPER